MDQPVPSPSTRSQPSIIAQACASVRRVGVLILLIGVIWVPGLIWYSAQMPDSVDDPDTVTDAIVVLTGGSERLRVALELLEKGKAPKLFVSGVYPETTLDDVVQGNGFPESLKKNVILGYVAVDTVGNAVETAVWMRENHIRSIRLVTAAYHMPRSLLEFRAAVPRAKIVANPVFPPNVKHHDWWSYPGTAVLFASEYTKYLVAHLRLMVPDRPPAPFVE